MSHFGADADDTASVGRSVEQRGQPLSVRAVSVSEQIAEPTRVQILPKTIKKGTSGHGVLPKIMTAKEWSCSHWIVKAESGT